MSKRYLLISLIVIVLAVGTLFVMDRLPFCKCGVISVWSSDVTSNQQSQQLTDPYTVTHVLHGIGFYFLIWFVFRKKLTLGQRLVLAVGIESGWEVLENTSFIIDRYRAATISFDYYGDSIFTSVGDILAMMIGFWVAAKLPWWGGLAAFVLLDLALLFFIRDSLIVNIIMLIRPIDAIKQWQQQAN